MKKKSMYVVVASSLMMLVCIIYQGAYAYFSMNVEGSGNQTNNTTNVTAVSLGEIKYEGELTFQSENIYPGYQEVQVFTIGPDRQEGKGIYEIDLEAKVPEVFQEDIEIKLYKTTHPLNNKITKTKGELTQEGEKISQEDKINIIGAPELVYEGVLKENKQIILEQKEFEIPGLETTTYYIVYHYKNNGVQDKQQGSSFEGKITVRYILEKLKEPATTYLTNLASSGDPSFVYDNTKDNNLRYIGANPNNYVLFNNELWRIIGVMNNVSDDTGDISPKLKIIRKESYKVMSWASDGFNDWSKATSQIELNTTYYESLVEKDKIANINWKLGGIDTYENKTVSQGYEWERGTEVYNGNPVEWTGKIGLMYPSDYGYATSGGTINNREKCLSQVLYNWSALWECKENDWLKSSFIQWTLTSMHNQNTGVFNVRDDGSVSPYNPILSYEVSPALYLKANTIIESGEGTEKSPFILS